MLARAVSSLSKPSSAAPFARASFNLGRASFHSSNSRHVNAFFVGNGLENYYLEGARKEVAKKGPFEIGMLDKWGGLAPFAGSLFAIAATKEILLLDAELLLGVCTLSVFTGIYVAIGNQIKDTLNDTLTYVHTWFGDVHDCAITACGLYKAEQAAKLGAGPVWKQYLTEYKDVMTAHSEAMALKPQHLAREKVLATLESIRVREQLAAAGQWRKFVTVYDGSIRKQLNEPAVRDALFSASIRSLNDDAAEEEVENILEKVLLDAVDKTDESVFPDNMDGDELELEESDLPPGVTFE